MKLLLYQPLLCCGRGILLVAKERKKKNRMIHHL
jgi:hypothetical protein